MPKQQQRVTATKKAKQTRIHKFALSSAELTEKEDQLLLTGIKGLNSHQGEDVPPASIDDTVEKRIGTDQNFYYYIAQRNKNGVIIRSEKGVGEVIEFKSQYFLIREFPTSHYDGTYEAPARPHTLIDFLPNLPLTISSFIPDTYYQALLSPFSVLCSIEAFTPSPVELEENTLLGRKDDLIQSIDKDELREILTDQSIIAAIGENPNVLKIQGRGVNLSKQDSLLSTHILHVKPAYDSEVRPTKPRRGSIIFNDETKNFEGYNGKEWKPLKWGD